MFKIKSGNLKQLKILIKADTNWSLEAMKSSLLKLSTEETSVLIIHSWVWNISESDILMCQWSEAILVWFWVSLLPTAKSVLEKTKIEFINSKIIYHITEKIEKIITWMLDPKEIETILWKATVWWIFYTSKEFRILWLKLKKDNNIENWAKIRVLRWDKMVWKWEIKSLKLWVEEMKQLEWPVECGIKFVWNTPIEMWDIFELYKIEYK
jgi:translation initiation factor IF-2